MCLIIKVGKRGVKEGRRVHSMRCGSFRGFRIVGFSHEVERVAKGVKKTTSFMFDDDGRLIRLKVCPSSPLVVLLRFAIV